MYQAICLLYWVRSTKGQRCIYFAKAIKYETATMSYQNLPQSIIKQHIKSNHSSKLQNLPAKLLNFQHNKYKINSNWKKNNNMLKMKRI